MIIQDLELKAKCGNARYLEGGFLFPSGKPVYRKKWAGVEGGTPILSTVAPLPAALIKILWHRRETRR